METKRKAVLPGVTQLVPRRLWGMADLKGPPSFLCSAFSFFWTLLSGIWAYGTSVQLYTAPILKWRPGMEVRIFFAGDQGPYGV